MRDFFFWLFRGIPLGLANVLPGLSGGTIALLLGYYVQMVQAIKGIELKQLVPLAVGTIVSIFAFATIVDLSLQNYLAETNAFLLGLIFASAVILVKPLALHRKANYWLWPYFLVGVALALVATSRRSEIANVNPSSIGLIVTGMLGGAAMLLPGISGATVMILTGYYGTVIKAVRNWEWGILILVGTGIGLGLVLLANFLTYFFKHHRRPTLGMLSGMILGSMRAISVGQWSVTHGFLFLLGFLVVSLMQGFIKNST